MKIFGIDPGSERTGFGCVESSGSRHRLIACGALTVPARATFPEKLTVIHTGLAALLARHRPECVAVENIFYARNVRSALKLGHARGVALLAAAEAGIPVVEYAPAEIKRAIVGYGRAEKGQVQQMVKLLLGLETAPSPHDAADALAVAICHLHLSIGAPVRGASVVDAAAPRSWRDYGRRLRLERGCPPPLVADAPGDQLRRGLAVARRDRSRAKAEGPASIKK
ncbi:MAG: crossover junction endodeoxyribonuclease RuvC [Vicinamibacterales bacterium]